MRQRRNRRIHIATYVVSVLLMALLAGPVAAQRTKLVIMMPGSTSGVYPDGVIEGFQAKYPDIDVEVIGGPWGDLTKIPVMAAAGTLPDVWYGEAGRAAEWGHLGILADLKPYIDRDLDLNDFFLLEASSDPQGRVWGIPGGFQMTIMYYMQHMFDAAGLGYPDDSWNVNDLVDNAKKLTRRDGDRVSQYGIDLWVNSGTVGWLLWAHLLGGSVLDETLTQSRLNTPETLAAMEFLHNFMWVEEAAVKYGTESGFDIYSNNLAMQFNIYKRTFDLKDRGVTTFDVAKIPAAPDGRRYTTVVPNVWMMNKDSAAKDAAWEFIKYYISEEVQEKVVHHASEVPVNRHVGGLFLSQAGPPNSLVNVLDSFEFANTLDENAAWNTWFGAVPRELAPAFRNEENMSSALARAHQELQKILDEAYSR